MSLPSARSTTFSAARASRSRSTPTAPSTAWSRPSKRRAGTSRACASSIWWTFDAQWGHRAQPGGLTATKLKSSTKTLGVLMEKLGEDDLLLLTADHGNDPTFHGTDHTREYVPLLAWSKAMDRGGLLEQQNSFARRRRQPLPTTSVWPCLRAPSAPRFSASWVNRPIARRRRDDPWATKPSTRPCPSSKGWTRTGRPSSGVFQNRAPVADGVVPD